MKKIYFILFCYFFSCLIGHQALSANVIQDSASFKLPKQVAFSKPTLQKSRPKGLFFQKLLLKIIAKKLQKKFKRASSKNIIGKDTRKVHRNAYWSTILGVLALPTIFILIGVLLAILAIILGSKAIRKVSSEPEKYKGSALGVAGVVLGITTLFFFGILLIAFIFYGAILF
jgi:hypothetical protein